MYGGLYGEMYDEIGRCGTETARDMAITIRTEVDDDCRYRIVQTHRGFLVSCQQRDQLGIALGPAEWLYQTLEAAERGLEVIILLNAVARPMALGYPIDELLKRSEVAASAHREAIERLNDRPLIGEEVKALRRQTDKLLPS